MVTAHFLPGRWRGHWVWAADAPAQSSRTVVALRASRQLSAVPGRVLARVHGISGYVLHVNGEEVARGPVRANPRRHAYAVLDLAPWLRVGSNELAVLAWCYHQPMPWWNPLPGVGDLVGGAFVLETDLGWVTDASWRGVALPTWGLTPGEGILGRGVETIGALSPEWTVAPCESWPSVVLRSPYSPGQPSLSQPPSYPLGPVEPARLRWPTRQAVPLQQKGSAWLSTQGVVAGTVRLTVEGRRGAVLHVAERVTEGVPLPTEHDASFEVVSGEEGAVVETLDRYGLTGLVVSGDATVTAVEVVERLHPVTGDASFRCSDERLERTWAAGRRTVSLCSHDAYVDCPTREQRAWVGDAVVHQLVDLATNADWSLARWYVHQVASPRADGMLPMLVGGDAEVQDRMVIADWSLHWIHALHNLYRYIGDRDEVAGLLPVAEGVLRWFDRNTGADGFPVELPGGVLLDWAAVDARGASAVLCGLYGRALQEFAELSTWVGDAGRAAWAADRQAALAVGFERFWDPRLQRYSDALGGATASQHGQAAAIVGGLAPTSRLPRLVELLTDEERLVHACFASPDGPALPGADLDPGAYLVGELPEPWWDVDRQLVRAQPFFRYVVHDALVQAGRGDLVAGACLDWGWLLDRCPTTLSETWYGGTLCHGWSATPTRDLMTAVLGVRPAEPGFAVALVEPALGHLDWAEGAVPTPYGMLEIRCNAEEVWVRSPVTVRHGGVDHPAGELRLRC